MSLIEKAAKRLEELRRAGFETPSDKGEDAGTSRAFDQHAAPAPEAEPVSAASAGLVNPAASPTPAPAAAPQSRQVNLDLPQMASAGFVTPFASRTQLAEEFRVLKRPLIANASGNRREPIVNGNLIMVTSALPGEGKTFTSINLAVSIAMELDRTVLLVDADVARPALPKFLGLPSSPGLLDILQDGSLSLSDALLRTNIDKFSVLPSGTQHARATELLASDEMTNFLHELAHRYSDRIVIFDSPPLLVTTEARVLASHMGQIVFVVRAEATLQSEVMQALATIEACPVKLMVLNQASTTGAGGYGYRYGYRYAA
jgi:exopolysaccharide/PEP-CTERM locus tyrosine autokinase